jgi:two-component system OmpR family sensor kinase
VLPADHARRPWRAGAAERSAFRTTLAAERAGTAVAPVLILLPLSMFILWGVARAMSSALQDIGRQAAQLDEHNIAELPLAACPRRCGRW